MIAVKNELKCAKCGKQMQWVMDTLLCPVCNMDVIYRLNVWVKPVSKKHTI